MAEAAANKPSRDYTVLACLDPAKGIWVALPRKYPGNTPEQAIRAAHKEATGDLKGEEVEWEARSDWNPRAFGVKIIRRPNVLMSAAEARKQREKEAPDAS